MPEPELGQLKGVFGVSPAVLQRAAAVAFLSFVFFLLMMFGFYLRQNIGYFLLATAFLVVNLFTLIGWFAIRKKTVRIYEHGIRFRDFAATWDEITAVESRSDAGKLTSEKASVAITRTDGKSVVLPNSIDRIEEIVAVIKRKTAGR